MLCGKCALESWILPVRSPALSSAARFLEEPGNAQRSPTASLGPCASSLAERRPVLECGTLSRPIKSSSSHSNLTLTFAMKTAILSGDLYVLFCSYWGDGKLSCAEGHEAVRQQEY